MSGWGGGWVGGWLGDWMRGWLAGLRGAGQGLVGLVGVQVGMFTGLVSGWMCWCGWKMVCG